MKRPKKPVKAPQHPPQTPVHNGDVFATFLREAQSIGNEVVARREYDAHIVEFLEEKKLSAEWAQWLKNKRES